MVNRTDELVILGSGGGRHHIRTQYRATGGIIYKFNGIQSHIDPGPGAIVRINQFEEDPVKTELFIVTHAHVDHYSDLSAIIESSREILHDRNYNYYKKGTLITSNEVLKYISEYHLNMLDEIVKFRAGDSFNYKGVGIFGTKTVHSSKNEGFGIKFKLNDYQLAFTSDTLVYNGFSEQFSGCNILILNLLRPDSIVCRRHLCTDEVIPYLNKFEPPLDSLIITHFGSFMDSPKSTKNHVPSQVKKLQESTNIRNIIAAEDGLKLKITELLK
ncbi:MAG: MBL fold metallo-hydrolase [Candidatus Hodarchaeota archaeon]